MQRLERFAPDLTTRGGRLVNASLNDLGTRFHLTARSVWTGDTFSVDLTSKGTASRSCTGSGGCARGTW